MPSFSSPLLASLSRWSTTRRAIALLIAVTTAATVTQLAPAEAITVDSAVPTTTSYIVSFADGTDAAEQTQALADAGAVDVGNVPELRMHTVEVTTTDEAAVLAALRADTAVVRVEADKTRAAEATPDDPSYADQWGLAKIGWGESYGSVDPSGSAVVAVLDTGVDASHADLATNVVAGTSMLDGSDGATDPNGHGTAMAGIVAARTNNGSGIAGVGYQGVSVMPVTVLGPDGTGQDSDVIAGLVYAADHGADVALVAFSSSSYSPSLQAAVDYAWSKGVVIVGATGNDGSSTPTFPAGDRGVVGVSNTTQDDTLNASSNYGDDTFLAAPGTGIVTTAADGGTQSVTGTSASAAVVAGAAALLKANDASASNSVIVGRLARNADAAGSQAETGNGRLNLARALADTATDPVKPSGAAPIGDSGPFVGPYVAADKGLSITFAGGGGGTISFSALSPSGSVASCVATCSRQVENSQTGTMTVTPAAGSTFTGWSGSFVSGGTTTCTGITSPCTFSMSNSAQALTATFSVAVVNHAPSGTDKTITVLEDATRTFAASDVGFTDPNDTPAHTLSAVKITTLPAAGSLRLSGVAVSVGQTVPAAQLGNLTYAPAVNANGNGYASFTFQVQDNGGTANGGVDLDPTANTVTFNVTSVNDAPGIGSSGVSVREDEVTGLFPVLFPFSDTNDSPPNAFSALRVVSLPAAGSLTVNGAPATVGTSITPAQLAGGALAFTPAPGASGSAYAQFTYRAQDDGGTANGGEDLSNIGTMIFTVRSVNDAPRGTDKTLTILEDDTLTFGTADFGFSDPNDSPANVLSAVKVTTLPSAGSLRLNGAPVVAGASVSVSDIVAGNLRFVPAADAGGSPYTTFTFQVQDDGGTTFAGIDLDPTPNTITLNVTSVNDAPSGASSTVNLDEDGMRVFGPSDFGFSDPHDSPASQLSAVRVATLPVVGSLRLAGNPVSAGDVVTLPDLTSGALRYFPPANAHGNALATFTFQVIDDGGVAAGGVNIDPTPDTVTIDVASVNDPPVGSDVTVTTDEDTAYSFSQADFGYSDPDDAPADSFAGVRVTGVPSHGSLRLDGVAVPVGDVVGAAAIADGRLRFVPAANQNGAAYATFTFQVKDSGGAFSTVSNLGTVDVTPVNDAPVAADDQTSTDEDTALTIPAADLLGNDSDIDGDTLTIDTVGSATHGAASTTAAGDVIFTPASDYNGPATFVYTVSDGHGGTANATVDIDVRSVNDAPVLNAINDATVDEQQALSVTAHAHDVDGDILAFSIVGAEHGARIDASTGELTWTPTEAQGPGTFAFTVRVSDGAMSADRSFEVDVAEVNRAPSLDPINDRVINELTTLSIGAVGGDPDIPANTLTYTLVGSDHGATIDAATGALAWTPTEAQGPGTYAFTVRVTDDGVGASYAEQTFSVRVDEVNQPPVLAEIDRQGVAEESTLQFTAQATDGDDPANHLTYSLSGAPAGASIDPDTGTFSWTPTEEQGPDSYPFTVSVSDGSASDSQLVTVDVAEVNVAPSLQGIADDTIDEETPFSVTASASDVDLPVNHLAFSLDAPAYGASIDASSGAFSWTPSEAQGPGSYTFTVRVTDDGTPELSDTTSFTVTVHEVNVAPVLDHVPDASVDEETLLSFTATASDHDLPANQLTFALQGAPAGASIDASSGAFSWTPSEAQGPGSYTFTVRVTDDGTPALSDAQQVTVDVREVNVGPVLDHVPDASVDEETLLSFTATASDHDLPANQLTFALQGAPAGASIDASSGAFSWTPSEAQGPGSYTFTVRVTDDGTPALSDEQQVTVDVREVNVAPVADDDAAALDEDGAVVVDVLGNDTDHDVPANVLSVDPATLSTPEHGTVSIVATGPDAGAIRYMPDADYNGEDSFTYRTSDAMTASAPATVALTVRPVNDAPTAADLDANTDEDAAPLSVSVGDSVSDVETADEDLSYDLVSGPMVSAGTVVHQNGDTYVYTPAQDFNGTATFTYRVTDRGDPDDCGAVSAACGAARTSTTATVTVHVAPVNDTPVAEDGSLTTNEDAASLSVNLRPLVSDVETADENLSYDVVTGPAADEGVLAQGTNGQFTFVPAADYNGTVTVTYTVTDRGDPDACSPVGGTCAGAKASDVKTVTITVREVNDKPTATADTLTVAEDAAATTVNVLGNDVKGPANESGQTLSVQSVGSASHGTVTLVGGVVRYAPDADFNGPDSFSYVVTDNGTSAGSPDPRTDSGTVTVTVTEVNDKPTATADTLTVAEDAAATTVNVLGNDVKGPANESGQTLSVQSVGSASHGTVTLVGGVVRYAPDADFNGPDSFSYVVTDNGTSAGSPDPRTDSGTVTVTVTAVNDAPVVTAGPARSTNEGSSVTVTASFTDVDLPDTFTAVVMWGDGTSGTLGTVTRGTLSADHVYADNGSYTATFRVTDDGRTNGTADAKSGQADVVVSVSNLAPAVAQPSISVDPVTGVATLTTTFTDAGVPDTFPSGGFDVSIGSAAATRVSGTITRNAGGGGGSMTGTLRLPSGCYAGTIKATASVTDDDGGTGTSTVKTFATQDVYTATWKDPIRDNERNIAKYGNVVPVKLALTSTCTGATITTPNLFLTYVEGNVGDDQPDGSANVVAESVSNADTDNQMRLSGSQYMYNLTTKGMQAGKDYTVRVRVGSSTGPVIKSALFQPKK